MVGEADFDDVEDDPDYLRGSSSRDVEVVECGDGVFEERRVGLYFCGRTDHSDGANAAVQGRDEPDLEGSRGADPTGAFGQRVGKYL